MANEKNTDARGQARGEGLDPDDPAVIAARYQAAVVISRICLAPLG